MGLIHVRRSLAFALTSALASGGVLADASSMPQATLDRLRTEVVRAEDVRAIKRLQRAYGHYADRGRWDDLADLFSDDAVANYPSGGFDGNASIRAMFVQNLGQGSAGLADGRIYEHILVQPVVDLAPDGASATGRWRVLGLLGRYGSSATWADSLYRIDYVKRDGRWQIGTLTAYAGSGGSYDAGWTMPKPRLPGAVDTSPVRFNLAHPADRAWADPCEADVSACVVPFPYPNRGTMRPSALVAARSAPLRAEELVPRAQRLADEQAVLNLQRRYGYLMDRGDWRAVASLFTPDGTREVGQAGVYVGRARIRQSLGADRAGGPRPGELNDHLQIEPLVTVAPDGVTAQARVLELAFTGGGGEPARLTVGIAENEFVRRGGRWLIRSMHVYTVLSTDRSQGWAKSALAPAGMSSTLPPDRPPTVNYEAYPKIFTPPFHFANPSRTAVIASGTIAATVSARDVARAERQARVAADFDEIENLQSAWGYYAEKALWNDLVALFADDAVLDVDGGRHRGRAGIAAYLDSQGPPGPVRGALDSRLQLQPVIDVAPDGRSARVHARQLRLFRDAEGRPKWGGGVFDNELEKDAGIWKLRRVRYRTVWETDYHGDDWGSARRAGGASGEDPKRLR